MAPFLRLRQAAVESEFGAGRRRALHRLGALSLLGALTLAAQADGSPAPEVWVGHQIVRGQRSIPVIGDVATAVETFSIARVVEKDGALGFEQKACAVRFAEVMGVTTRMGAKTVARLPAATFSFARAGAGQLRAAPWTVAWGRGDLDRDGKPGVTVHVESSLCGGELYVGSKTTTSAKGRATKDGMEGTLAVRVQQQIFGASGWCLRQASEDSQEQQSGAFAYQRAAPDTTCASLAVSRWPVRAK